MTAAYVVAFLIGTVIAVRLIIWFFRGLWRTSGKLGDELGAHNQRQWERIKTPALVEGASCPTCHKPRVRRLEGVEKSLIGPDRFRQFVCLDCQYRW